MEKNKYNIAIMSVGSGVGQSVTDSVRLSSLPLKTFGFGNNPFAFGSYDCDVVDYLPTIYDKDYVEQLIAKCKEHNIDLIIPGLDDEAMIIANNITEIESAGLRAVVSKAELMNLVRDKERMCKELTPIADIFVKSYTMDDIENAIKANEDIFPLIAKPRDGMASRGIEIIRNKDDIHKITENHILQELAIPNDKDYYREEYINKIQKGINPQISEISAQFVTDKNGDLMGEMISYNRLNNGVPIEIIPYKNEFVRTEMKKLLPKLKELGHRGPLNIQGRLTDKGLKLFEMNARFTGITGLRAIMGFNEVEACIKSWLDIDKEPVLLFNYDRFGIRQTKNKSVSLSDNKKVEDISKKVNSKILKPQKTILVTGANGYLGKNLLNKLSSDNKYDVIGLVRDPKNIYDLSGGNKKIQIFSLEDLVCGKINLGLVDCIIHCAFARGYKGNEEIIKSLEYTNSIFLKALEQQVSAVINISSQAVYGTKNILPNKETDIPKPETPYAFAKYSSELMLNNIHVLNNSTNITNLRMAGISGSNNEPLKSDFITKIIEKIRKNEKITIYDGSQILEFIDVKDAVDAILCVLNTDKKQWKEIYNVGNPENCLSVRRIMDSIAAACTKKGITLPEIEYINESVNQHIAMDSSLIKSDCGFNAQYSIDGIINSVFECLFADK